MTFTYERRLATFSQFNWPHSGSSGKKYKSQPEDFAQAGFYCRPMVGSDDTVACFLCFKSLDGWVPSDSAWEEHKGHSATCPLVTLNLLSSRLRTFDRWPGEKVKGGVNALAAAGFFHFPKSDGDDTCICYQCGLALDGWEADDDPHHEHSRRRPNCPHVSEKGYMKPASFDFILAGKSDEAAIKDYNNMPAFMRENTIDNENNNSSNNLETPMKSKSNNKNGLSHLPPPPSTSSRKIKISVQNSEDHKSIHPKLQSQTPQSTPQSQKSHSRIVVSSTVKRNQQARNLVLLQSLFPSLKSSEILNLRLEELVDRLVHEKVESFDKFLRRLSEQEAQNL